VIWAPTASALVVHPGGARFLGLALRGGAPAQAIRGSVDPAHAQALVAEDTGRLRLHGGPVLHSSAPRLIFWTPSGEAIPVGSESLLERYFSDVAAGSGQSGNVFAVNRQYFDAGGYVDYRQTFAPDTQALVDTQPYPARDAANCPDTAPSYPTCITDGQLRTEISRLIAERSLPTGIGAGAPIYFVVTPSDVNVCSDASTCADNAICAYHSFFVDHGADVLYASIPLFINGASAAQNPKLCQRDGTAMVQEPNRDLADVAISYLSHEDDEVLTDPLGNGWWDPVTGREAGDECDSVTSNPQSFSPTVGGAASVGSLYDQMINGNPYYTQSEWSNGAGDCQLRPSPGTLTPRFSLTASPTPVGTPTVLLPAASPTTYPVASATWQFGDGSSPAFSTDPFALAPVWHTFTTPGRYSTALTLVDSQGNVSSATQSVPVGSSPAARIVRAPVHPLERSRINFDGLSSTEPDAGISLATYGWTFGDGGSSADPSPSHIYRRAGRYTVTLTVTNSIGLTAAAFMRVNVASFRITKVRAHVHRAGATLLVTVDGPGRLRVGRRTVRRLRAGTARLKLTFRRGHPRPDGGAQPALHVRVQFVPAGGRRSTRTVTIRPRR
jgi:hypothetical protein